MALDEQKIKQMDSLFNNVTGSKPQDVIGGGLPPIQEAINKIKSGREGQPRLLDRLSQGSSLKPREVFGEMGQDIKEFGQGVAQDLNRRVENVNEITNSDVSGLRKSTQVFGQGLGLFQDILGQGFKGIAKLALTPGSEQAVKEGVTNVVSDIKPIQDVVNSYEKLKETNPEAARDVETVFNTVMTAFDVFSFGLTSAARGATKEGVEQGVKTGVRESVEQGARQSLAEGVEQTVRRGGDLSETAVRDIASSLIPRRDRLVNSTVAKALDFTQGDLKNIKNATRNEPGQWLADKNLIRGTVEDTNEAVKSFAENARAVRDAEIAKITQTYEAANVPRYKDSLNEVLKQLDGKIGFEDTVSEVKELLAKETISLGDVQRAKELMDEAFNLYKITGDVSESTTKEGLSKVRQELRKFVENEVDSAGGQDIFGLNNDIATAKAIEKQIQARSTRSLTRANLQLGDFATFSAGSFAGGPIGGLIALLGKKTLQNPPAMLRFAKWLDGLNDAKKAKFIEELNKGEIPDEIINKIDSVSATRSGAVVGETIKEATKAATDKKQ